MEFKNLTPFDTLCYTMLDREDQEHHVIAMKVAYTLRDGKCIIDEKSFPSLCVQDEYTGEINQSSVRYESDLAPYKPKCDVIINGIGYAPGGKETTSFNVSATIRDQNNKIVLQKTILVQGEKQYRPFLWAADETEIEPFKKLPIDYQYAFGGENKIYEDNPYAENLKDKDKLTEEMIANHPEEKPPLAHTAYEANTIGRGFADSWYIKATKKEIDFDAPRILDPEYPFTVTSFVKQLKGSRDSIEFEPAGFGVIPRTAPNRRLLAGTYDEEWAENRHPYLPKDFDFSYWNGAPIDQQIEYPTNGMKIQLTNLSKNGQWVMEIPEHRAFILMRMLNGALIPVLFNIDTIIIEPELNQVLITHRLMFPKTLKIRVLEARFEINPDKPLITIAKD